MWTWSLNWGEVTDSIFVGTCPMTPEDLRRIRDEAAATAVPSLQHDDCHDYWKIDYPLMLKAGAELGLAMRRCPIQDFDVEDMRRRLPQSVPELASLRSTGHRVYVHCTAGLGRAPLTVLAYLIMVERRDPEEAIRLILRARPEAVPSWEAYYGFRMDLATLHRRDIERRAHELYLQGINGSPQSHWRQAEDEILAAVLIRVPGKEPSVACKE